MLCLISAEALIGMLLLGRLLNLSLGVLAADAEAGAGGQETRRQATQR